MKNGKLVKLLLVFILVTGVVSAVFMWGSVTKEKNNKPINIDPETIELVQLNEPKEGDPIAIVDTTLGEYRFVLYPDRSPNAVKNFTELAEKGYYDNTYVFHADSGAYSAAGSPKKDGIVNYAEPQEMIERELDQDLWPFKGAILAMNNQMKQTLKQKLLGGGTYYNGSRFIAVNTVEMDDELKQALKDYSSNEELADTFIKLGGVPNFSQQMTVIGQTYSGIEVVEKLSKLKTGEADKEGLRTPTEDIMINSVKISTYSSEEKPSEAVK